MSDEAQPTHQATEAQPARDGRALGLWSVGIARNDSPRFGGVAGVVGHGIPWHPAMPFPPSPNFRPVEEQASYALIQALTPLVAHLAAVGARGFALDDATGVRAIMAEHDALHALLEEALAVAGPVARQIAEAQRQAAKE